MCNLCVTLLGKFIEPDKKQRKYVNCKLCPKVLKYSGNTSNMRFHLESSHKAEFKVLQQSEKQYQLHPCPQKGPSVPLGTLLTKKELAFNRHQ